MRKLLIALVFILMFPTLSLANSNTTSWLMILSGLGLTVDGFQQINTPHQIKTSKIVDVSNPELTFSDVSLTNEGYGWWSAGGMIENTGNCDLYWTEIHVEYYWNDTLVKNDWTLPDDHYDCLTLGQSSSWDTFTNINGSVDSINYYAEYEYDPVYDTVTETKTIYKKETKNTLEGLVGLALIYYGYQNLINSHSSNKPKKTEIKPIIEKDSFKLALINRF